MVSVVRFVHPCQNMKIMKTTIQIISVILLLSTTVVAQPIEPNWKYIRPTNTGLGGDYFRSIEVDGCGDKWTGGYLPFYSEGSVVRFDDSVFTAWSNFEGYIPNAQVYGIAFDQNNGVWVACNANVNFNEHGGVAHYDGTTWTKWDMTNAPFPTDLMNAIAVDHNNDVWVTFYDFANGLGGLGKFDGTTWTIYTPANSGLPTIDLTDIDVDAQNNIWIASHAGLVKFDGVDWTVFTQANSGIVFDEIRDVEVDEGTNKVYAVTAFSVDIYDGTNWSHISASNAPFGNIYMTEVDAKGATVMIGSVGGTAPSGVQIFNDGVWTSHITPGHVKDVRIADDGTFWTCGNGFVEKYDGSSWTTYTSQNTGSTSMLNNAVFVDSRNRIWLSSDLNGGINVFDCPKWQDYGPYNQDLWPAPIDYTGTGGGVTEDSYGDIWMAFNGLAGGVVQVPGGDVNNSAAWHLWDNANSGVSLQFLDVIGADHTGQVYIGHDNNCSFAKFDHATDSWTEVSLYNAGDPVCVFGQGLNRIRVDSDNNVWFCGTFGLAKYDQTSVTYYNSTNTPLPAGNIADIAFDALGNKWIATEQGLYKFDDVNWTLYDTSNTGLIANWITALLIDNSGTLWASCEDGILGDPAGLCSFDGTTWTQYTTANSGLQEKLVRQLEMDTLGNILVLSYGKGAALFNPNGVVGYECIDRTLQACIPTSLGELNDQDGSAPTVFPNPFSNTTTISFELERTEIVTITIYDGTGRTMNTVPLGSLSAGAQKIQISVGETWGMTAGIYFAEMKTATRSFKTKLIVQ